MKRRFLYGLAAALLAVSGAPGASAQAYPSKPVRVIVPFPPGGALDGFIRTLSQPVGDSLGQPMVVENRPGASGIIGMTACARSAPDGYTLCTPTSDSITYNPVLFTRLPYDAEADFTPITNFAWINTLIAANAAAPMNSYKDMVSYAKANPGKLNWATWGTGTIAEIYLLWANHQSGINITAVPYKGAGLAVPALLSGEVHVTFSAIGFVLPHIKSGKVKALAITGTRRSPFLPSVPTLAEEGGDPGLDEWYGIMAPARTPGPIVTRINAEYVKALRLPKVQELMATLTLEPVGNSPSEFASFLRGNRQNAVKLINTLGIKPTEAPGS
jgi:tripartite-type tricarboxylate transporter receptor subunit TctC